MNVDDSIGYDYHRKHSKLLQKVRHYMFAYLQGYVGGSELEKQVKKMKKVYKSHHRVSKIN